MSDIFRLENDDYLWFRCFYADKVITLTRDYLNMVAIKYGINPTEYKNKRLLLKQILSVWEDYFETHLDFYNNYEEYHGCEI